MALNAKGWDHVIMTAYRLLLMVTRVISSLDAGRFHLMPVSLPLGIATWIGQIAAGGFIFWVVRINTFLSHTHYDWEQTVVTSGPHRFVRHLFYFCILLLFLYLLVALGSGWGFRLGLRSASCIFYRFQ